MRTNPVENNYIRKLDQPNPEMIDRRGFTAEEAVTQLLNSGLANFEARLSTATEDSGVHDIGTRQTIDVVAYKEGRPALSIQVTSAEDPRTQQKKMQELKDRPFIRLPEMNNQEAAIPKTLVFLQRNQIDSYMNDHDIMQHPELALQIVDGIIKSLKFDLTQTKNPQEIGAVKSLIENLESERKKYLT